MQALMAFETRGQCNLKASCGWLKAVQLPITEEALKAEAETEEGALQPVPGFLHYPEVKSRFEL